MVMKQQQQRSCMETAAFMLGTLDGGMKREMDQQQLPDSVCCGDQRSLQQIQTMPEQQQQQQQQQFPELGPAVGSLPGGGSACRRAALFGGCMTGFTAEYQHTFAAAPADSTTMGPDGRTASLLDDSVMWQLGQQPLDLRSDLPDEAFFLRRGAYGDMLANFEEHTLGVQQHHLPLQQQHQKLVSGYGSVESVPGSSSSFSASDDCDSMAEVPGSPTSFCTQQQAQIQQRSLQPELDAGIDDPQLITLSVRDLNRRLHGYPRDYIQKVKQRRRTLKNRGYAQNCRTKRIAVKCELEKTNRLLLAERERLLQQLDAERKDKERVAQERDKALQEAEYYKQQLISLRSREQQQQQISLGSSSHPSSPDFYV